MWTFPLWHTNCRRFTKRIKKDSHNSKNQPSQLFDGFACISTLLLFFFRTARGNPKSHIKIYSVELFLRNRPIVHIKINI
jgi:hypothetical protein